MRRPGDRRPVMTSAGIRAGANTVMVEPPASHSSVGVGGNAPPGSGVRRPDEAERYYNSPHVTPNQNRSLYRWPIWIRLTQH